MNLLEQAACAKHASKVLRSLSNERRNEILNKYANSLLESSEKILQANALDCKAAKEAGMQEGMLDRLYLDKSRIKDIAEGVKQVAALPSVGASFARAHFEQWCSPKKDKLSHWNNWYHF